MKQAVIHIPHSSTHIPILEGYTVSGDFIEKEILKTTDWYTDDLFHSENDIVIKADFSRIFCDPERFADDEHEVMARFGMGVLYTKSDEGEIIRDLTPELRTKILNGYYWVHHNALTNAVKNQLDEYGQSLIIDGHSFPHIPLNRSLDKNPNRPDFNIGTDSFHTNPMLVDASKTFFNERRFSLGIDFPYSGSIVPLEYYRKNNNVQSIMLEVNRKFYLKENSNQKSENYQEIKKVVGEFIAEIKNVR